MPETGPHEPFDAAIDHLRAELDRIDLLLRRYLERWWADRPNENDEFRGLYVSDAEVDRLLATPESVLDGASRDRESGQRGGTTGRRPRGAAELGARIDRLADRIDLRVDRSRTAGTDLPVATLVERFDLDRTDRDALLLALAPDVDRKYEKIYGYLQDDVTRTRPSVGLLAAVLSAGDADRIAVRGRLERGATLVDAGLIAVDAADTALARPVRVPERVGRFLRGEDGLPAVLAGEATVIAPGDGPARDRPALGADPSGGIDGIDIGETRTAALERLADRLDRPAHEPAMLSCTGPDEASASLAVAALCAAIGVTRIEVSAAALSGPDGDEALAALRREVRLRDDPVVHVRDLGHIATEGVGTPADDGDEATAIHTADPVADLVVALDSIPGDVFLTGDASVTARLQPRLDAHAIETIDFPRPSVARRRRFWAGVEDLPADADPAVLASTYRLTRGQIADAVETARVLSTGELTVDAIREACKTHSTHGLADLAREVEPSYEWDDIVLPPDTKSHLREVAAQIRHRGTVFEEWGFEAKYSRGNGVNVLFTGPSGTGKTMAAEVVAAAVGLPLFTLDLSSVMSKYVGETEKNLRRVFDAAERANAILFFDEADALFGERSEVSDSHDRYANVEVDYLLQRMEDHDGSVVLASNLAENIDDAFLRRINLSVDFPLPDRDARADIWAGVFPDETPVADLDVDFLADFDLAGGNIKNVATTAAFVAAEDGDPVSMAHVVPALRREFQKTGRLFDRDDFGDYRGLLPERE